MIHNQITQRKDSITPISVPRKDESVKKEDADPDAVTARVPEQLRHAFEQKVTSVIKAPGVVIIKIWGGI